MDKRYSFPQLLLDSNASWIWVAFCQTSLLSATEKFDVFAAKLHGFNGFNGASQMLPQFELGRISYPIHFGKLYNLEMENGVFEDVFPLLKNGGYSSQLIMLALDVFFW